MPGNQWPLRFPKDVFHSLVHNGGTKKTEAERHIMSLDKVKKENREGQRGNNTFLPQRAADGLRTSSLGLAHPSPGKEDPRPAADEDRRLWRNMCIHVPVGTDNQSLRRGWTGVATQTSACTPLAPRKIAGPPGMPLTWPGWWGWGPETWDGEPNLSDSGRYS